MPDRKPSEPAGEPLDAPSKSALKRQMTALQKLGESLAELSDRQLTKMPIDDDRLLTAIQEVREIRTHSARRRHLQFIGKLMRDIDTQPMADALASLHRQSQNSNAEFHRLEDLRENLLEEGDPGIEKILAQWPHADRQHLRALLRQHQREVQQGKPPAASRKLFRYLRQLQEESESS